jgi:hypothetical protein
MGISPHSASGDRVIAGDNLCMVWYLASRRRVDELSGLS